MAFRHPERPVLAGLKCRMCDHVLQITQMGRTHQKVLSCRNCERVITIDDDAFHKILFDFCKLLESIDLAVDITIRDARS